MTFRVVTYNTRGSLGMDNVRSTRRIADTLRPLVADVVCFQEIHRRLPWSGREDQPAALQKLLDRRFVFQCNVRFGFGQYGVGAAVRHGAVEAQNHLLPGNFEQRGALQLTLQDVGGFRNVTVFCTHWGLDEMERVGQAEALAALVNQATGPVVLCGDLNEPADGKAVRRLLELTDLVDTDALSNLPTFMADNPTVRIDYVFHSPHFETDRVEVVHSLASDHLPLCVDLSVG